MNAIVMQREMIARGAGKLTNSIATSLVRMPDGQPADWLPVPHWIEPASATRSKHRQPIRSHPSLWARIQAESTTEIICMGLLATAAVLGITYGFSCLADLVQNWSSFNVGVGHLIQ
jgi:hypothetical protein